MLLRARWVLPMTSDALEDGGVVVRAGRIHDVGPYRLVSSRHPEERVRDLGETSILFPGFVNVHAHLELTLLRGFIGERSFFPWLRHVVQVKADALRSADSMFHSLLGAAEMIRAGITCIADCTDTGTPFDALAVSGLRGIVFQEVFAPSPDAVASAVRQLVERLDGLQAMASDRLRVGISPHSPYMAHPDLLERVASLADARSLPLSLHVAESEAETAFLHDGTGPIADHHRARGWPVTARGLSAVEHLRSLGWLALRTPLQLVHLPRATDADLSALALARADGHAITLAACPRSNTALGNGWPDLAAWTRSALPWGLGTDGAPAVGACDIFAEMRAAYSIAGGPTGPAPTPRDIVACATIDAAESLGLADVIGSLERGKQADIAAVDLRATRCVPFYDPYHALAQIASPADVVLTMVAGDVLFDGVQVTTIDEDRLVAKCRERAAFLAAATAGRSVRIR